MPITYGTILCQHPKVLAQHLSLQGKSVNFFWGRANSFRCPVGPTPGRAYVLMLGQDISNLNINDAGGTTVQDLTFDDGSGNPQSQLICRDMLFVQATAVAPAATGDPMLPHVVELADARWLAQNPYYSNPVNEAYNVLAPAGGQNKYYVGTTKLRDGTTPFSWQEVIDDLWDLVGIPLLGPSPQLLIGPNVQFSPDSVPNNLRFHGVSAWAAVNSVLRRLSCALVLDPTQPVETRCSALQIGGQDDFLDAAEQLYVNNRLGDDQITTCNRAKVPARVCVYFHKFYPDHGTEPVSDSGVGQYSVSDDGPPLWDGPLHGVVVNDPDSTPGVEPGSTAIIYDDKAALMVFGNTTPTNMADLTARANERVADYYRKINTGGSSMHRVYAGFVADPGFLPGLKISGYGVYDVGDGPMTEVVRHPPMLRLDRDGHWQEAWDETLERVTPPDLGKPTFPGYPQLAESLQIVSTTTGPSNLYYGFVEFIDPATFAVTNQQECFIYNKTNAPAGLTLFHSYPGKLNGNHTATPANLSQRTLPLYLVWGGFAINGQCVGSNIQLTTW